MGFLRLDLLVLPKRRVGRKGLRSIKEQDESLAPFFCKGKWICLLSSYIQIDRVLFINGLELGLLMCGILVGMLYILVSKPMF